MDKVIEGTSAHSPPGEGAKPVVDGDTVEVTTRTSWRRLQGMTRAELARRANAEDRFVDGLPFTMSLD